MAGTKREKELHRAKIARLEREKAAANERRKKTLRIGGVVAGVLVVILAVVGIALASSNSDDSPSASAPSSTSVPSPAASSDTATSKVKCTKPTGKAPLTTKYAKAEAALQPNGKYTEELTTNCGKLVLALDEQKAPETTKAMTFLSDRNFYNNTVCHRLTTEGIYVLQCGDPSGNGTGGPGFSIPEENLPKAGDDGNAIYPRGTVAMANAGKGTTGSQFFLVYKDSPLPPDYTVVGTVKEGMPILDYVAGQGTTNGSTDGTPKQPLEIQKMVSTVAIPVTAPVQ